MFSEVRKLNHIYRNSKNMKQIIKINLEENEVFNPYDPLKLIPDKRNNSLWENCSLIYFTTIPKKFIYLSKLQIASIRSQKEN